MKYLIKQENVSCEVLIKKKHVCVRNFIINNLQIPDYVKEVFDKLLTLL